MEMIAGVVVLALIVAVPGYLLWAMVTDIRTQRRSDGVRRVWKNFALSITFSVLFLLSWGGQAVAEWQIFADDQRAHGTAATLGPFLMEFGQSTLENWQSEFLQLFSFVVLASMFIHRGSAESKDSDERMEALLKRIADKLDA